MAADGGHLWSERYDREMADIFAIQEVGAAAAAGLRMVHFGGATDSRPS
jgi:TolB-like protein